MYPILAIATHGALLFIVYIFLCKDAQALEIALTMGNKKMQEGNANFVIASKVIIFPINLESISL